MDDLLNTLIELEESLFTESVRKSRQALNALVHDEFEEITSSGQVLKKDDVIDWLNKETTYEINGSDYEVRRLSEELALLKYQSKSRKANNVASYALRTSIWKLENEKWILLFHQGTPINTDK